MRKIGTLKHNGTLVVVDPSDSIHESKFCGKHLSLPVGMYDIHLQQRRCDLVSGIVLIKSGVEVNDVTSAKHPNNSYWCVVDNGCIMLCDKDYHNETHNEFGADVTWFSNEVIRHTHKTFNITNDRCIITSAGHGYGEYPIYELYSDNELVGCCVKFIGFGDDLFAPINTDLVYILG